MNSPYRWLFALAAAYNLAFGLWAGLFPHAFFNLFALDAPRYPSTWACLGMVVGLYGLVYAYVAWKPETGDVLIAIGLAGKVLGPLGWLMAVDAGELPPRTFPLTLANDLVWWFPFLFYLLRNVPARNLIIVWVVVVIHAVASLALLLSAGGTEIVPEVGERFDWVSGHAALWSATWLAWALASMSLSAFTVIWARHLLRRNAPRFAALAGCSLIIVGLAFDLIGESVNVVGATWPGIDEAGFARATRFYAVFSAGIANGLYCVGGLILSVLSWRAGWVRGGLGVLGFLMWSDGLLLTAAAFLHQDAAMIVTGGLVMALFIPWAALMGWRLADGRMTGSQNDRMTG